MPRTQSDSHPSAIDWYDHPLWYDIVHAPDTAWEVDGLERIERRFADPSSLRRKSRVWLEPACGTGRYLKAAAARGRRIIGLDLSPGMIAFAQSSFQRRGLRGKLRVGDMTRFAPPRPRADFAFCLINSIRHLDTDAKMLAHLRCVRRALRPKGVYAVGISLTHYHGEFPTEEVFSGTRGRCTVTQFAAFLPPEGRFERVMNHLTITTPRGEKHHDNVYHLRCYSGPQWASMLRRAGFEVLGVVDEEGADAVVMAGGAWRKPTTCGYGLFVLRPARAG